jgi:hypothetical protein
MRHKFYPFNLEYITKAALKVYKEARKLPQLEQIRYSISQVYTNDPEILRSMEPLIHMEEYEWISSPQRINYFFDSEDLVENLIKSASNIQDETALYNGSESFTVAIPESAKWFPKITGMLVSIGKHESRNERILQPFFKWLKGPVPQVEIAGDLGHFTICATYRVKGSECWIRLVIPSHWIPILLNSESPNEWADFMRKESKFHFKFMAGLTREEEVEQYYLSRLLLGLLVYRKSLPHRITEGTPTGRAEFATPFIAKRSTPLKVSPPTREHSSPSGHYRSWHFRQLMNERFYKGEHKDKKIGSRIVFVSDSVVGQKQQPKTVRSK